MTTIASLAARDFVVVGCDSLATTSLNLVFPAQIAQEFFEPSGNLKLGADGKPLLKEADQIWQRAVSMPVNQLPSVTKLYDLLPAKAALLFAGASRIGETTNRSLVETFKSDGKFLQIAHDGTIEEIANRLKDFILEVYTREIPDEAARPLMEILVSGYSTQFREPEVWRMLFYFDRSKPKFDCSITAAVNRKDYDIVFGGQYDVIQRVVNGIDLASYQSLQARTVEVLGECVSEIESQLRASGYAGPIPKPDFLDGRFDIFAKNMGNVSRLFSDIGSLSEQAGINFLYFLINVMINSQEFSNSIPTVGGKVHAAMITKNDGFRWISQEGFIFEGQHIPKFLGHA